jgi:excisionase family DNA binding protein
MKATRMSDKLSYTIREAKAALGIGETNLRKQIRSGRLAVVRIGRKYLIPRSEIEGWLRVEARPEDSAHTKPSKLCGSARRL